MKSFLCFIALVVAISISPCESNVVDYEADTYDYYFEQEEGGDVVDYSAGGSVDYNEEWWNWDIFDWEWLVNFNVQQEPEDEGPHHDGPQEPHHHHGHNGHVARPRLHRPEVAVA
uniref:Uncharacterized protein n=1 Tax=Musca domestica TaxID=7370 RepID=A0A1I8NJI0_MUSDO